jgi:hypothetical protein
VQNTNDLKTTIDVGTVNCQDQIHSLELRSEERRLLVLGGGAAPIRPWFERMGVSPESIIYAGGGSFHNDLMNR